MSKSTQVDVEADVGWASDDYVVLSERPRIFYFPHFLNESSVQRVLETAEPSYTMGLLDGAKLNANVRNSATHFMTCEQMKDPVLRVRVRACVYATYKCEGVCEFGIGSLPVCVGRPSTTDKVICLCGRVSPVVVAAEVVATLAASGWARSRFLRCVHSVQCHILICRQLSGVPSK